MTENAIVVIKKYGHSPEIFGRFAEVLGQYNAAAYISSVLLAVNMNESLQKCTPQSIFSQAMRAATLRLSCDPGIGDAYLVPFKDHAILVIGYKGLYRMAVRTGKYRYINIGRVYEGEQLEEDRITGFIKIVGKRKSNTVIGYIAAFELVDGYGKVIYMSQDEIHEHARKFSKSYDRPDSTWKTNTEDMERKTVLRRLLTKWGYLDPADAMLVSESQSDEIDGEFNDMPDTDEITEPVPTPEMSEKELIGLLWGNDAVENPKTSSNKTSPEPEEIQMTVEEAEYEISATTGELYGTIDTDSLTRRLNAMLKVKKPSKEHWRKITAAKLVLQARAEGRPVMTPD